MQIIVTTFQGLETELSEEILALGGTDIEIGKRNVSCYGDKELLYRLNYSLRTGIRVLLPIFTFKAQTAEELYEKVKKYSFSRFFNKNSKIAIDTIINSPYFTHSQYVTYKVKDAIVDQAAEENWPRPSIDVKDPDVRINVHIRNDEVSIAFDSSGQPLFKRGYKRKTGIAPLNEIMAAGIVLKSNWDKKTPFIDPMTGSGTIAIEAGMIAANIPAQFLRREFGFMRWNNFNKNLYSKVKSEANSKIMELNVPIIASDFESESQELVRVNSELLPFNHNFIILQSDFFETEMQNAHIVFNPPFDERIKLEASDDFYIAIGTHLKHSCIGSSAFIFSANLASLKKVGLKPFIRHPLHNGSMECKLVGFKLFPGKRLEQIDNDAAPES